MTPHASTDFSDIEATAKALVGISDDERSTLFHQLRQELQLTSTVQRLNTLLGKPDSRLLGQQALRSLWLDGEA